MDKNCSKYKAGCNETRKQYVPLRLISFAYFNAQVLYSLTVCMLHYNSRHVSSINMPIFRRKKLYYHSICYRHSVYSTVHYAGWEQTAEQSALIRHNVLYCTVQRVTIPDAVIIQFVLPNMGMLMLETCRGL